MKKTRDQVITEWVLAWEDKLPFTPRPGGSDYNLHAVFVEATPECEADLDARLAAAGH